MGASSSCKRGGCEGWHGRRYCAAQHSAPAQISSGWCIAVDPGMAGTCRPGLHAALCTNPIATAKLQAHSLRCLWNNPAAGARLPGLHAARHQERDWQAGAAAGRHHARPLLLLLPLHLWGELRGMLWHALVVLLLSWRPLRATAGLASHTYCLCMAAASLRLIGWPAPWHVVGPHMVASAISNSSACTDLAAD